LLKIEQVILNFFKSRISFRDALFFEEFLTSSKLSRVPLTNGTPISSKIWIRTTKNPCVIPTNA
jgi:hypothetical protein